MRIEHSSWAKDKNNPPFNMRFIIIHHKFCWNKDNVVAVSHSSIIVFINFHWTLCLIVHQKAAINLLAYWPQDIIWRLKFIIVADCHRRLTSDHCHNLPQSPSHPTVWYRQLSIICIVTSTVSKLWIPGWFIRHRHTHV